MQWLMCSVEVAVVRLPMIVMGGGGAGAVAVAARINFILSIAIGGSQKFSRPLPTMVKSYLYVEFRGIVGYLTMR